MGKRKRKRAEQPPSPPAPLEVKTIEARYGQRAPL